MVVYYYSEFYIDVITETEMGMLLMIVDRKHCSKTEADKIKEIRLLP